MKRVMAGEMTIGLGVFLGVLTIIMSGVSTYYVSQASINDKIFGIKELTSVHTEQIDNLESVQTDIKKAQDRIEDKVDALLIQFGVNPNSIK